MHMCSQQLVMPLAVLGAWNIYSIYEVHPCACRHMQQLTLPGTATGDIRKLTIDRWHGWRLQAVPGLEELPTVLLSENLKKL
jgi:hypothetical protein